MNSILESDFKRIYDLSPESLSELQGKRLLLTGGTGFFGKWILGFLHYANLHHSLSLKIFVLSRRPEAFLQEFPEFKSEWIEFIAGDIRDFSFESPVDFVIHAATEASAKLNEENPKEMLDVVVAGTKHVLDLCKKIKPKRILFTSSGAVYGTQTETHQSDETKIDPSPPKNAYADGKRLSEELGIQHSKLTHQMVSFARCYAFVGPYLPLDAHFAVGNFMNDCLKGQEIVIKGDGTSCRSYLYAADLVIWLLKILTHGQDQRTYNVGSDESITIRELAQKVSSIWEQLSQIKISVKVEGIPKPEQKPHRYVPSVDRAQKELGLKVNFSLNESLARSFQFYS